MEPLLAEVKSEMHHTFLESNPVDSVLFLTCHDQWMFFPTAKVDIDG